MTMQKFNEGKHHAPAAPAGRFAELMLDPEQLIEHCRTWNEKHEWGFTERDFQNLPEPPKVPDEPFCTLVLTPCPPDTQKLTGLQRGFDDLWALTVSQQPDALRWNKFLSDPKHLQLLEGVPYEPGLFWEVLNLGAHWDREGGTAPHTVRDPKTSPHLGVLAATAHHLRYVPTMDGTTRPFLRIPGLRVTVPGSGPWQYVPCVLWNVISRAVYLYAYRGDSRSPRYAVPARREE